MFNPILTAVVPVLLTILLGFGWVRSGRSFHNSSLVPLVTDVGTPCLIFSTLAKTTVPAGAFAVTAVASATAIVGFAIAGTAALLLVRLRLRTYLPSIAFANAGNLGLPLALYGFGSEGLNYAIVFFAISSIANYTLGQTIAAGSANWGALFKMPLIYAVAIGMVVSACHIALPPWLSNTVSLIGGMTVPLMLLMLGVSLGRLKVAALGRAALVSCLRIGVGACVGIAVALLFGITGVAKSVLIMQCAMPVAVYNYLFAERWNNEPEEVAGLVVVSTIASIFTVPVLLQLLSPLARSH